MPQSDSTEVTFQAFLGVLGETFSWIGPVSDTTAFTLFSHYRLLLRWNRVLNLTTVTGLEEAVRKHYCESLFLAAKLPAESLHILDVGSGAGFPGVPIAAVRPDCQVVLAERRRRKAAFLKEATRGWPNVVVFAGEAEDLAGEFDWVVSRAVAAHAVLQIAAKKAGWIGLLASEDVAEKVANCPNVRWQPPVALPWSQGRVLLIGEVVRCGV